jgi:demethylmacrocin O-methyltransferase
MWRDYFPHAQVHGIDIKPYTGAPLGERITLHMADQGEAAALELVAHQHGPFDLVVDDGSHQNHHQKLAFQVLWPFVKPGGCMVIEDVCCSYWSEYGNASSKPGETPVEFFLDLVHDVNFRGFRVGRSNRRDAGYLLNKREEMPKGMHTDIEEIVFANSTVILRKRL